MITICLCKWHDPQYRWNSLYTYDARSVNVMASMIARNLTLPHRIVCFTDDPEGIEPPVECHPIWQDFASMGACYRRLKLFDDDPRLREILGERFVSIDLDAVIIGSLDGLFDRQETFLAYKNILVSHHHYCGALWMLKTGEFPEVWRNFRPDVLKAIDLSAKHWNGSDQVWMSIQLGPYHPRWTNADGVYHFKVEVQGKPLPENAKIVVFNGAMAPWMPEIQQANPWIVDHWR